jgi:uncharacterized SAM-binding protein YcdF (DUF218 family)
MLGGIIGFLARDVGLVEMASAWLIGAAIGALVARRRTGRALLWIVGAGALLWVAVAFTPLAGALVSPLIRAETPRPADAVVVLASRLQRDGDPTPTATSRLLGAFALLRAGLAPRLVLTELPPPAPSHAAVARREMALLGVDAEIVDAGRARSTREEALRVGALCRERGWKTLLVVTSPTHSRRACGALAQEVANVVCVPAREPSTDLETLDRPAERLEAFRLAVHEWLGLLLYRARGWVVLSEAAHSPEGRSR